jgi:hypothetical protein
VVGKARDVDQISPLADALLVAQDEVELSIEDASELFLVRMHVQRRAFLVRLVSGIYSF